MKISYMLLNKSGKAKEILPGQARQWTYNAEDASQLTNALVQPKRDIREDRLALVNLRIERHKLDVDTPQDVALHYKGPIIYDGSSQPQRIVNRHALSAGSL